MACRHCDELLRNGVAPIGEDMEDGVGDWTMERLSDGVITLAYSESENVLASLEISFCPFCGRRLA